MGGREKDEFDDFTRFSEELLERCVSDVEINRRLFLRLSRIMRDIGYSEESCEIEHETRRIIDRQQDNGFFLDVPGATGLSRQLRQRGVDLAEPIQSLFPPNLVPVKTLKYRLKEDGSPYQSYLRHVAGYPRVTRGQDDDYTCWDWRTFNLASPKQRIEKLLELGWVPEKFGKVTKRMRAAGIKVGNPMVDEDSLVAAAESLQEPALGLLAEWLVCFARANMIDSWLKFVDPSDSKVHGTILSCGALSRRMTHRDPNTSNIPSNDAKYGKECRGFWRPTPGWVQVGYDAKGIQMRLFGHFCDMYRKHRDIYETYLGDPHTGNAQLIGQGETRRNAKNHFYAFIFGAQAPKLGKMVGKGRAFGEHVTAKLFEAAPGLKEATEEAKTEFRSTGRLRCLDGGFVHCTGEHAAFNYQVQPAEAVVMKKAMILLDEKLTREGVEHRKIGDNHDEGQHECRTEGDARRLGELAADSIRESGEHFNLRVPMEGDYKIGASWADTH